ncbi:hypothetical protein EJ08DRAFT_480841 [Tothia fuscella]|uniref:Uncharacterized protein n=1 Tax=Tothia fuscella TaxID=1048955 RepID=A0A9P4TUB1_9PEZI|nr:hypothetical protein EJ08DRAFT_480841 [Tothia fuscella]
MFKEKYPLKSKENSTDHPALRTLKEEINAEHCRLLICVRTVENLPMTAWVYGISYEGLGEICTQMGEKQLAARDNLRETLIGRVQENNSHM